MSLLLVAHHRDMNPFKKAIEDVDPNIDVEIWPAVRDPKNVQFAVSWRHPKNVFANYPNLQVISSLGAGVDHLLDDPDIPDHITFTRVVSPSLTEQMSEYILTSVLNIQRRTQLYFEQQQKANWETHRAYEKEDLTVGVMGIGELGRNVCSVLYKNGYRVLGWSRSKKNINGVDTYTKNELDDFLSKTNILVCLLPLTDDTSGILDLDLFKKLAQPAFLINAARGEHLVEEDLIYSLDTGLIEHATLDVFTDEPLPDFHPFWNRKKITITPHVASITKANEVAELLVENYKSLMSGQPLRFVVDRKQGY